MTLYKNMSSSRAFHLKPISLPWIYAVVYTTGADVGYKNMICSLDVTGRSHEGLKLAYLHADLGTLSSNVLM